MDTQEIMCVALLSAILVIAFMSPNYIDCFTNVITEHFGNYYPIKDGKQGTNPDLGIQAGFPFFNPQTDTRSQQVNYKNIQSLPKQDKPSTEYNSYLRNYDGSIVNGYQPSIIRPLDTTTFYKRNDKGEPCSWPMYAGNDNKQVWCNEEDAIKYYAMRPLKTATTYNEWLQQLFNIIVKPGDNVSRILDSKLIPKMYCWDGSFFDGQDEQKKVMKWIMRKVAEGVNQIPSMRKNSTWGNEQFHYTDDELYAFTTDNNKGDVYKLVFNLYNPLRSTATLVEAVIVNPIFQGKETNKYVLVKMDFVNKGEWNSTDTELPSGIQGYNLPKPNNDIPIDVNSRGLPQSTVMGWNYGNTLNKQEFNEFGFYEPSTNVKVKGGVPDSLKKAIQAYDNKMLLPAADLRFTGEAYGKVVPNTGTAQLVDPSKLMIYGQERKTTELGKPKVISV